MIGLPVSSIISLASICACDMCRIKPVHDASGMHGQSADARGGAIITALLTRMWSFSLSLRNCSAKASIESGKRDAFGEEGFRKENWTG